MPLKPCLLCLILFYLQLTLIGSAPRYTSVIAQHSNTNDSVSVATVSNDSVSVATVSNDSVSVAIVSNDSVSVATVTNNSVSVTIVSNVSESNSGVSHQENVIVSNRNVTNLNVSFNVSDVKESITAQPEISENVLNVNLHDVNLKDIKFSETSGNISTQVVENLGKNDNSSKTSDFKNIQKGIFSNKIHMQRGTKSSTERLEGEATTSAYRTNKKEKSNETIYNKTLIAGYNQTNLTETGNTSLSLELPSLSFIKRPPNIFVAHTRDTAIFECIPYVVNKTYDVTIKWVIPRNVPIISKEKTHSSEYSGAFITPNNSILIVSNMAEKFSGIYTCVVTSSDGSRIVAKMTLRISLYMDSVRRWLIIGFCGGGTCVVIIIIFILSCKIENDRKKFYAERRRLKQQQVLISHRQ